MMAEVTDEVSPLLRRLDADARTLIFGMREPRVRRPISAAVETHRVLLAGSGRQPTQALVEMQVLTHTTR